MPCREGTAETKAMRMTNMMGRRKPRQIPKAELITGMIGNERQVLLGAVEALS